MHVLRDCPTGIWTRVVDPRKVFVNLYLSDCSTRVLMLEDGIELVEDKNGFALLAKTKPKI